MTADEFVEAFEGLFKKEKRRIIQEWNEYPSTGKKPQAFTMDFGVASAALNKDLRARCKEPEDLKGEPVGAKEERMRLRWAYAYWWNRLHLLENMVKTKLGDAKTRKNIEKGGMTLRGLISGRIEIGKIHPQFLRLIESLNHMKIEQAVVKEADNLLKEEEGTSGDKSTNGKE